MIFVHSNCAQISLTINYSIIVSKQHTILDSGHCHLGAQNQWRKPTSLTSLTHCWKRQGLVEASREIVIVM